MSPKIKGKLIMAFRIWIAIFPSILLVNLFLGEWLTSFSTVVRSLMLTLFLVPWMVFILLPFINWLAAQMFGRKPPVDK